MKRYEKPMLTALSLNGNDQLCGFCSENDAAYLLYDDKEYAAYLMEQFNFGSGTPDANDFVGVFGLETQCTTQIVTEYCKYSVSGMLVAWS